MKWRKKEKEEEEERESNLIWPWMNFYLNSIYSIYIYLLKYLHKQSKIKTNELRGVKKKREEKNLLFFYFKIDKSSNI